MKVEHLDIYHIQHFLLQLQRFPSYFERIQLFTVYHSVLDLDIYFIFANDQRIRGRNLDTTRITATFWLTRH